MLVKVATRRTWIHLSISTSGSHVVIWDNDFMLEKLNKGHEELKKIISIIFQYILWYMLFPYHVFPYVHSLIRTTLYQSALRGVIMSCFLWTLQLFDKRRRVGQKLHIVPNTNNENSNCDDYKCSWWLSRKWKTATANSTTAEQAAHIQLKNRAGALVW